MSTHSHVFPFTALVGQENMRLALVLNAINPAIGGVLIRGERGTAKSTAVRGLAHVLPELEVVANCPFGCPPHQPEQWCQSCAERVARGEELPVGRRKMRVVNLPINASEDRVVGTLDLEHALTEGKRRFEPGVLAGANRNILYVDEVNLLDDHIVDVLLDAAAMGVNIVEREGVSFVHPSRFILVGTMNPEEGELRPQLLDRFGLCVDIETIRDVRQRVTIIERREAYEADPEGFLARYRDQERALAERIQQAQANLTHVEVPRPMLELIARINIDLGIDGHRGDIVMRKTAQTYAAYLGKPAVTTEEVYRAAELALAHRLKRDPLEETRNIRQALAEIGIRRPAVPEPIFQ
jgi:Mg-chelatase subunit ChlI